MARPAPHARAARPRRPAWQGWLHAGLVALLLLKAAVPWMAALAAQQRGVDLVEVCSVYGMRTVALSPSGAELAADDPATPAHDQGADHGHCALSGVMGSSLMLLLAVLAWLLPAAAGRGHTPPCTRSQPRPDPLLRWLGARLHAPPVLS